MTSKTTKKELERLLEDAKTKNEQLRVDIDNEKRESDYHKREVVRARTQLDQAKEEIARRKGFVQQQEERIRKVDELYGRQHTETQQARQLIRTQDDHISELSEEVAINPELRATADYCHSIEFFRLVNAIEGQDNLEEMARLIKKVTFATDKEEQ